MSLSLPADAEEWIPDGGDLSDLHGSGCYVLRYERPNDLQARMDRRYDNHPYWFDLLHDAEKVLYVGQSGDVMGRLNDHQNGEHRTTVLTELGCEPIGIVNIMFHDSAQKADEAEYNTAKRVARQTDDGTLTICNGEPV